jgi:high-affinity Fe2+/Pb2+ permease
MRRFFQVTGVLIVIFAAGLLSKAVLFVQGNTDVVVYNVTGVEWLTGSTEVGKFLIGVFGWDPAPSVAQFAVYWGYLVPALVFFFWDDVKGRAQRRRQAAPEPASGGEEDLAPPVAVG